MQWAILHFRILLAIQSEIASNNGRLVMNAKIWKVNGLLTIISVIALVTACGTSNGASVVTETSTVNAGDAQIVVSEPRQGTSQDRVSNPPVHLIKGS